jgi:drug/metabolite transporter, DME family
MRPARLRGFGGAGAVLLAATLWGSTGTVASFAPAGATPEAVGAARIVVGGLILAVLALRPWARYRRPGGPDRVVSPGQAGSPGQAVSVGRAGLALGALGALSVAAYQISFFSAVSATGVAVGTMVAIGSAPVLAGLIARLAGGPALTRRWMAATAGAVTGCVILVGGGQAAGVNLTGVGLALLAGLSYALYAVVASRLITQGLTERVVMGGLFGGGAVLLLPLLLAGPAGWLLTARGMAIALYLGVITTVIAYLLYGRGLRSVPVAVAVTLGLAEPAVAALLAVMVLGERLTAPAVAGLTLIGIALAVLVAPRMPGEARRGARRTQRGGESQDGIAADRFAIRRLRVGGARVQVGVRLLRGPAKRR